MQGVLSASAGTKRKHNERSKPCQTVKVGVPGDRGERKW